MVLTMDKQSFISPTPLDPITAKLIAARFIGFLGCFIDRMGLDAEEAGRVACDILREAETGPDADPLLGGGLGVDLSIFNPKK